ncbi:MAG: hypothetical protein V3V40_03785 [Nitrosomonadaceae bacterium]
MRHIIFEYQASGSLVFSLFHAIGYGRKVAKRQSKIIKAVAACIHLRPAIEYGCLCYNEKVTITVTLEPETGRNYPSDGFKMLSNR